MTKFKITAIFCMLLALFSTHSSACTGVRLIAQDGSVVYGRTMEWGTFDLRSRINIVPVGYTYKGTTPDGKNGKTYATKYGFVGLDMVEKYYISDGMNEKGLAVGMFYHPGFASYPTYNAATANNTISSQELANYILSQFATIEAVKQGMRNINVVGVIEAAIGIIVQGHWIVTDTSGRSIVIEYIDSELKIHEAPLGVITNAPSYDWHMTNLRNYVNLSNKSFPAKKLSDIEFGQLGAGTGMLGLPGDNTPPSRFIRAVAWTQTARPLDNSAEGVNETLRILDNFQLPLGPDAAEGHGPSTNKDLMRSSTIWTTAWDLNNLTLNYHTQHSKRVRQLDIKSIDFNTIGNEITYLKMDKVKAQDIEKLQPVFK